MKIKFIDTNKSLCDKVEKLGYFKVFNEDITKHITENTVMVTASNPSFTFGGGIDRLIAEKFPKECEQKQRIKGGNERINNIIFTITVDNNLVPTKTLIYQAINSILVFGKEDETILLTGLGTGIGGLSEDDFIDVLLDIFPRKAYKGFKKGLICDLGSVKFQFEIGKEFIQKGEAKLCNNGFHFGYKVPHIYQYYPRDCVICEIEVFGELDIGQDKSCSSKIKVIRELDQYEIFKLNNWNTGNRNTGNRNTGNLNTGNRNTGDWNTGNRNTGNRNTGDWNKSDYNTGYFNSKTPKVTIFNKLSKIDFGNIYFPSYFYFNLTQWIYSEDMTEQEKNDNPTHLTTGGYLKKLDYKEEFKKSFERASKSEIQQTIDLPNFDYKIFEEISGISKKDIQLKLK